MTGTYQLAQLRERSGSDLGVGDWHQIDQQMVDQFADATGDHQWIHQDQERAAAGPYGTTIAHGYMTLAMAPQMIWELLEITDADLVLNKGIRQARFLEPVRVGSRVRGRVCLAEVKPRPHGYWELTFGVVVECDDTTKPAVRAEVDFLFHQADSN